MKTYLKTLRVMVLALLAVVGWSTSQAVSIPGAAMTIAPKTLILYDPSALLVVPLVVPFMLTLTPGSAEPSSEETTFPEITLSCAII